MVVHQLSRGASQNPFRKAKGGRVVRVAFHPAKPFFFVTSQAHVRRRAGHPCNVPHDTLHDACSALCRASPTRCPAQRRPPMRVGWLTPRRPASACDTRQVRVYNLAKQALAKKLLGGGGALSCLAVHPGGDHVLVGSDDRRVAWYDLDLSDKPYKAMRCAGRGQRQRGLARLCTARNFHWDGMARPCGRPARTAPAAAAGTTPSHRAP